MKPKKLHPFAVCAKCGAYAYTPAVINERCTIRIGSKRCRGLFRSTWALGDWKECPSCQASGFEDNDLCSRCNGAGWLNIRDRKG